MRIVLALGLVLALDAVASAHVMVLPARSEAGGAERYTVIVPTEGESATVRIELQVPLGVEIAALETKPGWQGVNQPFPLGAATVRWSGGRIPPGEMVSFELLALNPVRQGVLTWNATQWYENGERDRWGEGAPAGHEASTTTLAAASGDSAAAGGAAHRSGGRAEQAVRGEQQGRGAGAQPAADAQGREDGAQPVADARASAALWIALMALAVSMAALLMAAGAGRRRARQ